MGLVHLKVSRRIQWFSMRAGLHIMPLVCLEYAGPEASPTREVAKAYRKTCSFHQLSPERYRDALGKCPSQPVCRYGGALSERH